MVQCVWLPELALATICELFVLFLSIYPEFALESVDCESSLATGKPVVNLLTSKHLWVLTTGYYVSLITFCI